jgi:thiosulfate reductase cytochrome b subunit
LTDAAIPEDAIPEATPPEAAPPEVAPVDVVEVASPPSADHEVIYRHTLVVRITHWINVICILLLLMSGLQIFNAHPRLYWGQYGADADHHFLSMLAYPTGADPSGTETYRGETQIGGLRITTTGLLGASAHESRGFPWWSTLPGERNLATGRRWHFFMAWLFVINGLIYLVSNAINGHFKRDLAISRGEIAPRALWRDVLDHLMLKHPTGEAAKRYNTLQKLAYLGIIFLILPLMVLTGLTMSPGFDAFAPLLLSLFGGRQSARSIHFICANLIVLFVIVHLVEVMLVGVVNEVGSMITGRYKVKLGAHG